MEELALYGNQVQAETTSTKKEVDKPIFYNAKEEGGRDQLPREPRYAHYTPLNVSRSHILDQALATEILVMPKRVNTLDKDNFSKFCLYHCHQGHSTGECSVLKDKIEGLIKMGHPKDFIHKPQSYWRHNNYRQDHDKGRERDCSHHSQTKRRRSQSWSREREEKSLDQLRCVINTIVRGLARREPTTLIRKRHLQ